MTDSMSLITAQITFLDPQLVLVHIPIEQYSLFVQPILRLLFGEDHDEDAAKIPWTNRHDFFSFSITPLECSIICSKQLAEKDIIPVIAALDTCFKTSGSGQGRVTVYEEVYTVIQVDGQGLDAGQRVLELTGPLAMAGIARRTVTVALEQRGFVFSKEEDAFISQLSPSLHMSHSRPHSSSSDESRSPAIGRTSPNIPSTPPAKDIDELQARTFKKLKKFGVKPFVDKKILLVSCAGSREPDPKKEERLKNDLLQVLISTPKGTKRLLKTDLRDKNENDDLLELSTSFLSLTITASEPISILFEEHLLPRLGKSLYGAKSSEDILVPIMFDLRHLAFETTGIIGGVAGRLSQTKSRSGSYVSEGDLSPMTSAIDKSDSATEISFLSTAKAGTVILKISQLDKAVKMLNQALDEIVDRD